MRPQAPQSANFDEIPYVGTVVMLKGQRYELVRIEPYVRKDGAPVSLMVWRSYCANCADDFESKTTLISTDLNRRCRECVAPGTHVSKKRRSA